MAARKKAAAKKTAAGTRKSKESRSKAARSAATRRKPSGTGGRSRSGTAPSRRASAAPDGATFAELEELAVLMERHDLVEVKYVAEPDGGRKIHVVRRRPGGEVMAAAPAAPPPPAAAAAAEASAAEAPAADESLHAFASPMVGTFYRAPSPEALPFVSVGDHVDPSSLVCIIEAMKVMNEITPDVGGEIVSIEVENGEAVEYGQTLMLIRPS